jgi:hypothetical protein
MGFSFSGKASKSKTTFNNNSTFNNTTTPIVPDWATAPVQSAANRVGGLLNLEPSNLVAPTHGLQQQAAGTAAGLSNDSSWLSPFMEADTPFASGGKAYDWIGRYMNPYLNDVVDSSAADFDANAGQVRAQQALDLAGSGAFGGSGAALTQSMTEGELSRARASTLSGLRSQGYNMALQAASGDADRATQARVANAQTALQDRAQKVGFGFEGDANQRANIATQAGIGGTLRDIDQQQRLAPVTSTQQVVAMLNGLPLGLFAGQNEQGTKTDTGTSKTKGFEIGGGYEGKA